MRLILLSCLFFMAGNAIATEYIYRDLMANTLPTLKCASDQESRESATKPYTVEKYSKKFCRTQGYGWHTEQVKDQGKLVCEPCSSPEGTQRCHIEDMVVQCKRIKPGSVGMLPGKS